MLEKFKDMGKALKQAKEMKGMMEDVQRELQSLVIPVDKNGIRIQITGELEVKSVEIHPSLLAENKKADLEKAVLAGFNDAIKQAKDTATNKLQSVTGGLFSDGAAPGA